MAQLIRTNFTVAGPLPLDAKYNNAGSNYTSVSQVNSIILSAVRYEGLTVNINGYNYSYQGGTADGDLKLVGGLHVPITGFVSGAGTVSASDTLLQALNKLDGNVNTMLSLPSGNIIVGSAGGVATDVTMSGDATISNLGVLTLANTAVTPNTYGSSTTSPAITIDSKGRITAAVDTAINHNALLNFVANKHIDHTTVSVIAGNGIANTGLGDITASRTITVDIASGANIAAGTANKILDATAVIDEDSFASDLNTKVPTQQSTKAYVDAQIGTVANALKYRGALAGGSDISGTATGNAYVDSGVAYKVGDFFKISSSGNIITSSGSVAVSTGDSIIINTAVAHASITAAQIDLIDSTDLVSSVFGRLGAVVATNGDYTASQVTNVAAGNIAAVTVQAAINELDGEKLDKTLSLANLFVGNGSSVAIGVALSGDATITNTGVITIGNGAVTNIKLANSTISGISLGSNLADLTVGTGLQLNSGSTYNGGTAKTISLAASYLTQKYTATFTSGTWSAPSGGYRTISILASTHLCGTSIGTISVWEDDATDYVDVMIDKISVNKTTGDVTLRVADGFEFNGKYMIRS